MADEGASPAEQLVEACRRGQVGGAEEALGRVLEEDTTSISSEDAIANVINTAQDGQGWSCLHLAASRGHFEIIDLLTRQDGVEVDPILKRDGDSPLHKAVLYSNENPDKADRAAKTVEILFQAGTDPRTRNNDKLKALDLVLPYNQRLRTMIQMEEHKKTLDPSDIAQQDEGGDGPASDSD